MSESSPSQQPEKEPLPTNRPMFRAMPPGNGVIWLQNSWQLFLKNPSTFLGCTSVMLIILFFLVAIPFLAPFFLITLPMFSGGLMLGCHRLSSGRGLKLNDLFSGFQSHLNKLAILGSLYFLASVVVSLFAIALAQNLGYEVIEVDPATLMQNEAQIIQFVESLIVPMLIMMLMMIPVNMALWFAPALITLKDMPPTIALKQSFSAAVANIFPLVTFAISTLVVFFLIGWILGAISIFIPFLGFLLQVLFQLFFTSIVITSMYTSFIDVFSVSDLPSDSNGVDTNDSFIV